MPRKEVQLIYSHEEIKKLIERKENIKVKNISAVGQNTAIQPFDIKVELEVESNE